LDYSRFISTLARGDFHPAYLFLGKEDYLCETGVNELVSRLLTPDEKDLNFSSLTAKDSEAISQALSTPPLFAARRVILIKQAGDLKDAGLDQVIDFLKRKPGDACLILWAGDADKRKGFYKRIEAVIEPVMCDKLKPEKLAAWISDYIFKYGKKVDAEANSRLVSVNWPSLRELAGELDRLTLMVGAQTTISLSNIEEMGSASFGFERWRFTDAIASADAALALTTLRNLQDWGMKANQVVGDLFRMLRQLWIIRWHIDQKKVNEAKGRLSVQDFVFGKLQRQAGSFTLLQLEEAMIRTLDAELSIKRGNRDEDFEAILVVTDVLRLLRSKATLKGAA